MSRTIGGIIYTDVIVNIFAVIDRRLLDFPNGRIDLGDGHVFLATHSRVSRTVLKHPARGAQVA